MDGRNWLAKPHRQMYDDIHGGPGIHAGSSATSYYDYANHVLQDVHADIKKGLEALSSGWSGTAADGAAATARTSADWADAASVACIVAAAQSTHQAGAYVDARNAMPEPVNVPDIAPGKGIPAARVIIDVVQAQAQATAAHAQAAHVMSTYESSTAHFVSAMPSYPALPTATVTASVTAPPTGTTAHEPRANDPRRSHPAANTTAETPAGQPSAPSRSPSGNPSGGGDHVLPGTGTSTSAWTDPRGPAGLSLGAVLNDTNPAAPGGPNPGYANGTGRRVDRPVRGVANGVPNERPGGGRSAPLAGTSRVVSGSALSGRGAAGMAPGFVPGTGKATAEDKEHKRNYVVLDDRHLADGNPPLAPPVIGEEDS